MATTIPTDYAAAVQGPADARGIISNWPTLKARIANDGLPRGRMLGRNTRVWTVSEIEGWIASRPVDGPRRRVLLRVREAARARPAPTSTRLPPPESKNPAGRCLSAPRQG